MMISITSKSDRNALIVKTYGDLLERHGYTSCARVAAVLNALGIKSRRGGYINRQAVWRALKKTEEGLAYLELTKERIGR